MRRIPANVIRFSPTTRPKLCPKRSLRRSTRTRPPLDDLTPLTTTYASLTPLFAGTPGLVPVLPAGTTRLTRPSPKITAKVDSGPELGASLGAITSLSRLVPPSLQPTLVKLTSTLSELAVYLETKTGLPAPAALAASLCLILAIPLAGMWSYWQGGRPTISPYASMNQGRAPNVTDEDYSYITSQDLEPTSPPEDDKLIIRFGSQLHEAQFPAYAIGDGKLKVHDVRDRVALLLDLPESQARRVRLYYKGRQLKEPGALVRDYGVKNLSEILAKVRSEDPRVGDYGSDAENIVVEDASSYTGSNMSGGKGSSTSSKTRPRKRKSKKKAAPTGRDHGEYDDRPPSPGHSPAFRKAQLDKLEGIATFFQLELMDACSKFSRSPPADATKREDEHRRLTESVLQMVILKLDGVEPDGDEVVRARRKELIKEAQGVISALDEANRRR